MGFHQAQSERSVSTSTSRWDAQLPAIRTFCCSVVDLKIFGLKVCYGGNLGMKFVSRVVVCKYIHIIHIVVMCMLYIVVSLWYEKI